MLLPHLKAQINAQMTSVKKELSFYGEITESEVRVYCIHLYLYEECVKSMLLHTSCPYLLFCADSL